MTPVHKPILAACLAGIALGGCATITHGTSQTLAISTPGVTTATCRLTNGKSLDKVVTTPSSIVVHKQHASITVSCKAAGGQTASRTFAATMSKASKIQTPGGYLTDALSGAMWAYPAELVVPFNEPNVSPVR